MTPKERVEVQKIYSIENCRANPEKIYVFGDNLIHQGTGGQAIIRYEPNVYGIPTKRLPTMDENNPGGNPFFSDKKDEIQKVSMKLARLTILYNEECKPILVFPEDGLGTGRAMLKEKSPTIYNMISEFIKINFGINIMP